jgi:hypothetical protein
MSRQWFGSETGLWLVAAVALASACESGGGEGATNGGAAALAGAGGIGAMAGAGSGGIGGAGIGVAGSGGAAAGAGAAGASAAGDGAAGTSAGGAPSFTRVWNEVLVAKGCAGEFCHGGAQGGLSFDNQMDAYMNLVGMQAAGPRCGGSGMTRVQPNAPDSSLLLLKMSNAMAPCGDTMPPGVKFEPNCLSMDPSVCTTQAELQLVRDWIAAGAMND